MALLLIRVLTRVDVAMHGKITGRLPRMVVIRNLHCFFPNKSQEEINALDRAMNKNAQAEIACNTQRDYLRMFANVYVWEESSAEELVDLKRTLENPVQFFASAIKCIESNNSPSAAGNSWSSSHAPDARGGGVEESDFMLELRSQHIYEFESFLNRV